MKEKKTKKEAPKYTVTEKTLLMEFLLANVKSKSRNNIKSMLTRGNVYVNDRLAKKYDFPLRVGDVVSIVENKPLYNQINPKLDIMFENEDMIVIAKPHGLLSVASDKGGEETAYHFVAEYIKAKNKNARIYIVHRLDKDTSGIIVFAKNADFKTKMQENWNELVKTRGYTAVVEGCVKVQEKTISTYLKETKTHFMYSTQDTRGQKAVTSYKVAMQNEEYSLLDIEISTGKKNQIRVHMSEMDHPIAGDGKYGADTNPLKRLCLHAGRLTFTHPVTQEVLDFELPAPKTFRKLAQP